jgi:cytochrome c556
MQKHPIALILALMLPLAAGPVLAADATDPIVVQQKALMKSFGGAAKVLGEIAGGGAFDAAAAQAAKEALVAGAADIAVKFEKPGSDPAAESRPEVWTNWDDFLVKAKALGDAAAALDATSADGVKAGMGAIGASCKGCHMAYRE